MVIPAYNRWPLVNDAVDSVLAQTFGAFEVIVVDDGSTDDTAARLREAYREVITVIEQENRERAAARNTGLDHARGEFVTFLDSDDRLESYQFEQFANTRARRPDARVFASPASHWDPSTDRLRPERLPRALWRDWRRPVLCGGMVPLPGLIVSTLSAREIGGFPDGEDVNLSEDWAFVAKLALRYSLVTLPRPGVRVRQHAGRTSGDSAAHVAAMRAAARHVVDTETERLDDASSRRIEGAAHRFAASYHYAVGDMSQSRRELRQAARLFGAADSARYLARPWLQTWLGARASRRVRLLKGRARGR